MKIYETYRGIDIYIEEGINNSFPFSIPSMNGPNWFKRVKDARARIDGLIPQGWESDDDNPCFNVPQTDVQISDLVGRLDTYSLLVSSNWSSSVGGNDSVNYPYAYGTFSVLVRYLLEELNLSEDQIQSALKFVLRSTKD